jgi:hypothetical protein
MMGCVAYIFLSIVELAMVGILEKVCFLLNRKLYPNFCQEANAASARMNAEEDEGDDGNLSRKATIGSMFGRRPFQRPFASSGTTVSFD